MITVADLEKLGYTVGIAHGSVEVEQAALEEAKAAADPAVVGAQVNEVVADTVKTLGNLGMIPDDPGKRHELFAKMGETAFEMLTAGRSERVAFHERALQIAKDSPDVHVVQHVVDDQIVAQVYVACKDDGTGWDNDAQAQLDALADKTGFDERVFQVQNADAFDAARQLQASGADVTREPGETSFTVDGKTLTPAKTVAAADALP